MARDMFDIEPRPRIKFIDDGTVTIPPYVVKTMLGGYWPPNPVMPEFSWDAVDEFRIESGELVPYAGNRRCPAPNLKLVLSIS